MASEYNIVWDNDTGYVNGCPMKKNRNRYGYYYALVNNNCHMCQYNISPRNKRLLNGYYASKIVMIQCVGKHKEELFKYFWV